MGITDCSTFATLNLMFATLEILKLLALDSEIKMQMKIFARLEDYYLSLEAATTTGNSFWQVMSEPNTGAKREIACKMVRRYK